MKTGKALLGVLAALFSGALLGLIFAPDKRSIAEKRNSEKLETLAADLNRKIDEKFNELRARTHVEKNGKDSVSSRRPEVAG